MIEPIDTNALLSRLQGMAREAGLAEAPTPVAAPRGATDAARTTGTGTGPADFGGLVGDALRAVDSRSDAASALRGDYERGASGVELADVMIAAQKARVSFEALLQVRNKMVSAYRDVMNMPL